MLDYLKALFEFLKGRSKDEIAKISAYFLAPVVVLGLSILGFFGGGAIDLDRPIAISELRTEITGKGEPQSKRGIVLIAEPVSSEYRIQLGPGATKIWSSLDEETARANADRLVLNGGGLNGKTPFIGVSGPVTLVVDGDLGKDVQVLGGTEPAEDWRLASRRSSSLVSSVLAACFFAFGVSLALATGTPSVDRSKNAASQEGTEPDKD
jgi:hypothetical protein